MGHALAAVRHRARRARVTQNSKLRTHNSSLPSGLGGAPDAFRVYLPPWCNTSPISSPGSSPTLFFSLLPFLL